MFFEKLEDRLGEHKINNCYYETFNNYTEQGLVLKLNDDKNDLFVWACQSRNLEDIMVVLGNKKECDVKNIFSDDVFRRAKYFKQDDYDSAVDYAYKQIKLMFKNYLKKEKHFKFDVYKSLEDIRRIQIDAKDLNYEDYFELASYYDEDEKYSCDLIIFDGKFGYRYNKHTLYGMERLTFQEENPNLDNEIELLKDMKDKLDTFIDGELEYDIQMDKTNIKI